MHPSMEAPSEHQSGNFYSPPQSIQNHTPPISRPQYSTLPLEGKVHEINKRLRQRPDYPDRWWWDQFALEFFDDSASMVIYYYTPSEGEKHYTIGRAMIPRYFSSIFEGGVTEMYIMLSFPREYMSHSGPALECDNTLIITQYHHPSFARVLVESRLNIQCVYDDMMRIRHWSQYIVRHKEYVPRDIISLHLQESGVVDSLLQNITLLGINNCTLNFLNVSAISGPIQSDIKPNLVGYPLAPHDCIQGWPHGSPAALGMMTNQIPNPMCHSMPDYCQSPNITGNVDSLSGTDQYHNKSPRPVKKPKRARKAAIMKDSVVSAKKTNKNQASPLNNMTNTSQSQDVMIVGEPVLMGGELGEGDERRITRLENNIPTGMLTPTMHSQRGHLSGVVPVNGLCNGIGLDVISVGSCEEPSISAALQALDHGNGSLDLP